MQHINKINGVISDYDGINLTIKAPFENTSKLVKQRWQAVEINIPDGRSISLDQRKKIYATFKDIADYTGYPNDEVKELMKYDIIAKTGIEYFSLSNVDMSTAREFLEHLIEFCLIHSIPTADSLLDRTSDISRYMYNCLINKKCCICGEKAELHHENAVGQGRNRKEIIHIGMKALPLCRKHHTEVHSIGQSTFNNKYHVYGIAIDSAICSVYKLKKE